MFCPTPPQRLRNRSVPAADKRGELYTVNFIADNLQITRGSIFALFPVNYMCICVVVCVVPKHSHNMHAVGMHACMARAYACICSQLVRFCQRSQQSITDCWPCVWHDRMLHGRGKFYGSNQVLLPLQQSLRQGAVDQCSSFYLQICAFQFQVSDQRRLGAGTLASLWCSGGFPPAMRRTPCADRMDLDAICTRQKTPQPRGSWMTFCVSP